MAPLPLRITGVVLQLSHCSHTLPAEPICKFIPTSPKPLYLCQACPWIASLTLSLSASQTFASPLHHTSKHTHTRAHTPERQERGKEVSGSPQTQRTSRGALTSLHCTQLPVFDYWLLWCLACTSAVGRRHCCLRSPCFQLSYLFFSFLHSFFLTLIWIFLTFSSFSPFNISLLPSNSHPCFSLFGYFHVIRTASFHLSPSRAISNNIAHNLADTRGVRSV